MMGLVLYVGEQCKVMKTEKKRHSKSRVLDGPIITNSEETLIEEAEREDDEADAGEGDEGGGEGSETQECI